MLRSGHLNSYYILIETRNLLPEPALTFCDLHLHFPRGALVQAFLLTTHWLVALVAPAAFETTARLHNPGELTVTAGECLTFNIWYVWLCDNHIAACVLAATIF